MKVHVLCPASSVTGGPEALHQLVDAGLGLGYDMAMVYLPEDDPDPTPEVFKLYRPRVVQEIVDAPGSVVIVPETGTLQFLSLRHATRVLWWLSVEHFQLRSEAIRQQLGQQLGQAGQASQALDFVFDPRFGVVHLAQSEYARQWVERQAAERQGLARPLMLTDYVRDEIVQRARALRHGSKEDIVAYNPKKGLEFTRSLMAITPAHIRWVPIENMSPAEVAALLGRAKLYVDFGPHPGRDRIPREAALCGCVVITNTQGSAGNAIDVPIPSRFKFDERHPLALSLIQQRMAEACANHAQVSAEFAPYRAWIEDQRRVFMDEVFWALGSLEADLACAARERLAA